MSNQWFRFYHEFANDPKVQRLSEQDQRRYVMLLCMRCNVTCNDDVTLQVTLSDENVTFVCRITDDEWSATKARLIDKKLIDSNNIPLGWENRQFNSDSSAARVAKHRELKKQAVTDDVTTCNVTVTPQNRTEQNRTDTEKVITNVITSDKFKKPTLEEIQEHAQTSGKPDYSQQFFDYYESNGWKVGRNPMRSWQAAYNRWVTTNNTPAYSRSPPGISKSEALNERNKQNLTRWVANMEAENAAI